MNSGGTFGCQFTQLALMFPCFIYGGYFGAAAGVMILALELALTDRTLPVANALEEPDPRRGQT